MRLFRAIPAAAFLLFTSSLTPAETLVVDASDPSPAHRTISGATGVAAAGDTVLVKPGIYRENIRLKQSGAPDAPIRFIAEKPGSVIITGADVITKFERVDGDAPIYRVFWPHKFVIDHRDGKAIEHHPDNAPLYGRAEQVIADDRQLLPCKDLADLKAAWKDRETRLRPPVKNLGPHFSGMFSVDTTYRVMYLWLADGSDPNAHVMQASTRSQLFGVSEFESEAGVHDVEVSGFIFRYAANFPQRAAVVLHGANNTVRNCLIEEMAGTGVSVAGTLKSCLIRNNGHTGGAVEGDDFHVENCRWEGNSWKPIDRNWEAGGAKVCDSRHGEFLNCTFYRNGGPGLWFDIDCREITVRDSKFLENELSGVFVEISRDIRIENNYIAGNATEVVGEVPGEMWSCGGIQIAESESCSVTNNAVIGNKDGITLREIGPRTVKTRGVESIYHTNKIRIEQNTIAQSRGYELAFWWDNAFFGAHPSQAEKFKSPAAWQTHLREIRNSVYDPAQQDVVINNTYAGTPKFLYGVPWRSGAKKFSSLDQFAKTTGFERDGKISEIPIQQYTSPPPFDPFSEAPQAATSPASR